MSPFDSVLSLVHLVKVHVFSDSVLCFLAWRHERGVKEVQQPSGWTIKIQWVNHVEENTLKVPQLLIPRLSRSHLRAAIGGNTDDSVIHKGRCWKRLYARNVLHILIFTGMMNEVAVSPTSQPSNEVHFQKATVIRDGGRFRPLVWVLVGPGSENFLGSSRTRGKLGAG